MAFDGRDTPYSNQERLLVEARKYPEIWRLLLGLAIIVAVIFAMNAVLLVVLAGADQGEELNEVFDGSTPFAVLVVLTSFAFVTLGVALAARAAQHRSLGSVIGQWPLITRQFWSVFKALLVLGAVILILPPYGFGAPLEPNLALSSWILLLPLSLAAVLIQTSAEEILFRGYMQQSLAARFNSRIIWMGVPAILFAAGHFDPSTTGENAVMVAIWAFAFSLLTADLTARAGSLGPAIALHFVNNLTALLLISLPDTLSGLALFHLPYNGTDSEALRPWLIVDFAIMIVGWLAARLVLRR